MRSFFSFISVLALIFVNTIAFASSPSASKYQQKIIYNPLLGTHFNSSSEGSFYIRVGSFKEATNADRYKVFLSGTLHYPVKIKRQGGYQVVFVGPIRKANEVRALSHKILALSSKNQTRSINTNKSIVRHKKHFSINKHPQFKSSSNTKGPFYIRAATFSLTNNADKYKNYLIQTFHKPVVIKTQGIYSVVFVGPIQSEAEMNHLSGIIHSSEFKKNPVPTKKSISSPKPLASPDSETLRVLNTATKYKEYVIPTSEQPVEIKIQANNQVVLIGPIQSEEQMKELGDMINTLNAKKQKKYIKQPIPLKRSSQDKPPNLGDAYFKAMDWVNKNKGQYAPLATLSIGLDFLNPGNAQTLTLFPPFQNHYTRGDASQTVADIGMFLGVEKSLNNTLSMQFGISGYADAQITPKGEVWQFAVPEFNTISYAYHIHNTRLMATSKLLTSIPNYGTIHPYLSGELGLAFNQASGYQETAIEAGAVPMEPFSNASYTSFSWGVGAGFDYFLGQHLRLGIGYQFADLGSVSLNPTPIALTKQSLSCPHLYANQVRFQSTFLM